MYKIEEIPGKGEGAVATLPIKHGTTIEREKPLFQIAALYTSEETFKILRSLSKEGQRQFFALKNSYPSVPVVGIVRTNAFPLGCDSMKAGVFPKCSKFNHSCNPNCNFWWNEAEGVETIWALKDILPGQELTIMYSRDELWFRPRLLRQEILSKNFNFKCVCEVCLLSGNALYASEKRMHAVSRIEAMLDHKILANPGRALGFRRQMLTLLAQEAAELGRDTAYYYAFQICVAHGDLLRASAFMTKYVAERKFLQGGDDGGIVEEEHYVKNPERHRLASTTTAWKSARDSNTILKLPGSKNGCGKELFDLCHMWKEFHKTV